MPLPTSSWRPGTRCAPMAHAWAHACTHPSVCGHRASRRAESEVAVQRAKRRCGLLWRCATPRVQSGTRARARTTATCASTASDAGAAAGQLAAVVGSPSAPPSTAPRPALPAHGGHRCLTERTGSSCWRAASCPSWPLRCRWVVGVGVGFGCVCAGGVVGVGGCSWVLAGMVARGTRHVVLLSSVAWRGQPAIHVSGAEP